MKTKVSPTLLEKFSRKTAAKSLDMHDPTKSVAEIVEWEGKAWIVTGYMSSGDQGVVQLDLRAVVPSILWQGDYNDLQARGLAYYTGGRFSPKKNPHETWVITERKVTLHSDPALALPKAVQLSFV